MIAWAAGTLAATTLLVALVLLIREPVARMFGARAAYALWLAPLLRMLLPPLPQSTPVPELAIDIGLAPASDAVSIALPAQSFAWTDALLAVWLTGAALFLLFHVIAHRRFLQAALRQGRRLASPEAAGPELIESAAVEGPIATGILRKRILLPLDFGASLTPEQRRLAIAHEQLHHSRGDLLALALSLVLLALHWFNPLAHWAHRAFRRDLEAACDAQLAASLSPAERESYARAILGCAARPLSQAICTLTTIDDLKRRLTMLTMTHGRFARIAGFGCAALIAAGGIAFTPQVRAQAAAPVEKETQEIRKVFHIDRSGKGPRRHAELEASLDKCQGEVIEASADASVEGKEQKTFVKLCGNKGATNAELAAMIDKSISRIEAEDDVRGGNKAEILAQLRSKAAELRAR